MILNDLRDKADGLISSSLKGIPVMGHTLPHVVNHCFNLITF